MHSPSQDRVIEDRRCIYAVLLLDCVNVPLSPPATS